MKFWKLGIIALCLTCLTACGKAQEPVLELEQSITKELPQTQQEEALQEEMPAAEFTFLVGSQPFDGGCLEIGGKHFAEKESLEKIPELNGKSSITLYRGGKEYVELGELCRTSDCEVLMDEERGVYILPREQHWQIPEGYEVPVLMYHGVSDDLWGMTELFVKPSVMEAQIQYLLDNGYTPIWFEDLPNVDKIEKPVILTYDDGYMDNYLELFPILQKYNVKATIFVVTGTIDYNPRSLTTEQIREMSDSGLVSIQSHTVSHGYLNAQTPEEQKYELTKSKVDLAAITGKDPCVICYPSGRFNDTTLELAKQYYAMGINMDGLLYVTGEDPYMVDRFYIRRQDSVGTIASYIQ